MVPWGFALLLTWVPVAALAGQVSCEVEYRAVRQVQQKKFYGSSTYPQFTSGVEYASGRTWQDCLGNARSQVSERLGPEWRVTIKPRSRPGDPTYR